MKVKILEIAGIPSAIKSMYISKKNLTPEIEKEIEMISGDVLHKNGELRLDADPESMHAFRQYTQTLMKWGVGYDHSSLLDMIQIYTKVEDLHRGAGDDFDAHARRMQSIIRSSTRLADTDKQAELSDWYKGKVEFFSDELDHMPGFIKTPYGWVNQEYEGNKDVYRGLVPLGFPQTSISSISYRQWRYIYYRRNSSTHAAPELKEMVEKFQSELCNFMPILGEFLPLIWDSSILNFISVKDARHTMPN